ILRSTSDTITDSNVADNGRVPSVNGVTSWNQETALPETGLSLKRINIYHAVQAVRQLVTTGNGSGGNSDLNDSTGNAVPLPSLSGGGSNSFSGSIGQDGQSTVGPGDIDL